jgi:tetratricopeptide (TPR) repeat protein
MRRYVALLVGLLCGTTATAQSTTEAMARGDSAHAAMNPSAALGQYQVALKADPNDFEALWKASREAIDLGEFDENKTERDSLFRMGADLARAAVRVRPSASVAHFTLAKALGRTALSLGKRDQVKYAGEVRREALEALRLDSSNAGALHIMGMWNAEIMRLSGLTRFFAKNLLGGGVFDQANWNDASRYLEQAVALEPDRIVHRVDLANVYADRGESSKAREQLEAALRLPATEYNDRFYKRDAERRSSRLK